MLRIFSRERAMFVCATVCLPNITHYFFAYAKLYFWTRLVFTAT